MVWSDQSQFPFYVIDNNGNIILTIDSSGLHLVGSIGRIDGIINGTGQPTFYFSDPTNMNPTQANAAYINAPANREIGVNAADYSYTIPVTGGATQTRHHLIFIRRSGGSYFHVVNSATQTPVGGEHYIDDITAGMKLYDSTGATKGQVTIERNNGDNNASVFIACSPGQAIQFGDPTFSNIVWYNQASNRLQMSGVNAGWRLLGSTGNPPFQNGWGALGGSYDWPSFSMDALGIVHMAGVLIGGTKTDGTVLFTLPTAFRPTTDKIVTVTNVSSGTWPGTPAQIRIRAATGNVEVWAMSTTTNGAHSWDGVQYDIY